MYRIFTSDSNLQLLDEQGIILVCAPDHEIYVSDEYFKRIVDYISSHEFFDDFSSEYVSKSEFTALCESFEFNPFLIDL